MLQGLETHTCKHMRKAGLPLYSGVTFIHKQTMNKSSGSVEKREGGILRKTI